MNLAWDDGDVRVYHQNALPCLREMPDASVHCIVTSPPYWGLRDYGTARWLGGDPDCQHRYPTRQRGVCPHCGARRLDDQLGLESSPHEYVSKLVAVFREARRVLRYDGTCWLNIGDSYISDPGKGGSGTPNGRNNRGEGYGRPQVRDNKAVHDQIVRPPAVAGLAPKNLALIPHRLALALQDDGWFVRCDVIWDKPNPMPESVRDRPTVNHEHILLLTRSPRYFYDGDAIAEDAQDWTRGGPGTGILTTEHYGAANGGNGGLADLAGRYKTGDAPDKKNARSVWRIPTYPFPGAHYAVMPGRLAARCIAAGTPEGGVCQTCQKPFLRATEYEVRPRHSGAAKRRETALQNAQQGITSKNGTRPAGAVGPAAPKRDLGWFQACACPDAPPGKAVVLDPFFGAGTTGLMARRMGRACVGIELSADSVTLAHDRLAQLSLL